MSSELRARAFAKVLWEFATYRWRGRRNDLRVAWGITFHDVNRPLAVEVMPATADMQMRLGGYEFNLYRHASGPRFVVHAPNGYSEIRAFDAASRKVMIGRGLRELLEQCAAALGTSLGMGGLRP